MRSGKEPTTMKESRLREGKTRTERIKEGEKNFNQIKEQRLERREEYKRNRVGFGKRGKKEKENEGQRGRGNEKKKGANRLKKKLRKMQEEEK